MPAAALGTEVISSAVAFRPRHPCSFYERGGTGTARECPRDLAERHWRAALAWLRFMPTLSMRAAELGAGAREGCLLTAARSRPCLRLQLARLRAWRREHWE